MMREHGMSRTGLLLLTVLLTGGTSIAQQVATRWTATGSTIDFGVIAADAGDVNGDGVPDIVVGEPQVGIAQVLSGSDGAVLHQWTGVPGEGLGVSVDGLGDVNGDGFDDVIVGSFGGSLPFASTGKARVFSGFDGSLLFLLQTPTQSPTMNGFGQVVAGVGDVDLDGVRDFAVGDPLAASAGPLTGEVHIYSGVSGSLLFSHLGAQADLRFGSSIDGAGDVNGDGFADVIVGNDLVVPFLCPPTATGRVEVLSGFDGSVLHSFQAAQAGVPFGRAVAGTGDLNQDGFDDFVFTTPGFGLLQALNAPVYSGFDGSLLFTIVPSAPGPTGIRLDAGKDVDGDGVNDIAVDNLLFSGAGGTVLLPPSVGVFHLSGDIDGDGFAEIIGASVDATTFLGKITLRSLGGAIRYGVAASPANTLDLSFQPGVGSAGPAQGTGQLTGAAPLSSGAALLSAFPAAMPIFGLVLLVDTTPGFFLNMPVAYGPQGGVSFPLDLRQPTVAGLTFFLQFFELNASAPQGAFASNGLAMLFIP